MANPVLRFLNKYPANILSVGCGLSFVFLLVKNSGLYPVVMPDEYKYIMSSRVTDFSQSELPNYLYFLVYRITRLCGDGYFECAKILNALFFTLATPFIYFISRRVSSPPFALLVALLSVLGPVNSYSAYFMPESLFYLVFWVFSWIILGLNSRCHVLSWVLCGVIYGLMILVKPHSIFILPGLFAYIASIHACDNKESRYISIVKFLSILLVPAFLVRFIFGYAMAGSAGLNLLGSTYGGIANEASKGGVDYTFLRITLESLSGHVLVIVLLFSVPLCAGIASVFRHKTYGELNQPIWRVSVFSLLIILNLLSMVALFTASVVITLGEDSERLHMRYYNFALPLFYIMSVSALKDNSIKLKGWLRWLLLCVLGGMALYGLFTEMNAYSLTQVDCPELFGIRSNIWAFRITVSLSIASLVVWAINEKWGLKMFLLASLPLCLLVSTYYVFNEQRNRLIKDVYDTAGLFVRQYLPPDQRSSLVVTGANLSGLFRTLTYLDNHMAKLKVIEPGEKILTHTLQNNADWLLAIGDNPLGSPPIFHLPLNGFNLYRIRYSKNSPIRFKKPYWPESISRMDGLSESEDWGTWSSGSKVTLQFASPLPDKFDVILTARAFGPNLGKEFAANVGDNSVRFKLNETGDQTVRLSFENPHHDSILSLKIPQPTSPKSLGNSTDQRLLGIGLVELIIQ